MGLTVFENLKFRKYLFLTSLDAARAPDAESLIREAWNLLAEELELEYIFSSKTMGLSIFEYPRYSKVPFFNIIGYISSSLCLINNP